MLTPLAAVRPMIVLVTGGLSDAGDVTTEAGGAAANIKGPVAAVVGALVNPEVVLLMGIVAIAAVALTITAPMATAAVAPTITALMAIAAVALTITALMAIAPVALTITAPMATTLVTLTITVPMAAIAVVALTITARTVATAVAELISIAMAVATDERRTPRAGFRQAAGDSEIAPAAGAAEHANSRWRGCLPARLTRV